MQTPNQSPEESEEARQVEQQPFYEFPPSIPSRPLSAEEEGKVDREAASPQQGSATEGGQAVPPQAQEDLIRQGLVYPPPPSFYQQNVSFQPPPLSPVAQPSAGPAQAAGFAPPGAPQGPAFAPPVQKKKSYRWLWITISILAVLLLAACSFCGWSFYNFFASTVGPTENTVNVANDYYAALQNKDYSSAFGYITPQGTLSGLTLDSFTKQAQDADDHYGAVRSYTATLGNFSTNSGSGVDLSHFTVVVNVARAKQSYSVLLTLQKSGNTWKIVDFDRI